jgi:hypothetical protein
VDISRPDGIARRPQFRNHRGHCRSVRRLQHAVRRTPSSGQPPASRFRRRGHRMRRLVPIAAAGGRAWTVGRWRPPWSRLLRGCDHVRGGQRPTGRLAAIPGHPADTTVSGSADTCWVRARSTQPPDIDGVDAWTADAAGGHRQPGGCPAPRTPATAAVVRTLRQGGMLDRRQQHRSPSPRVRPGTGPKVRAWRVARRLCILAPQLRLVRERRTWRCCKGIALMGSRSCRMDLRRWS